MSSQEYAQRFKSASYRYEEHPKSCSPPTLIAREQAAWCRDLRSLPPLLSEQAPDAAFTHGDGLKFVKAVKEKVPPRANIGLTMDPQPHHTRRVEDAKRHLEQLLALRCALQRV